MKTNSFSAARDQVAIYIKMTNNHAWWNKPRTESILLDVNLTAPLLTGLWMQWKIWNEIDRWQQSRAQLKSKRLTNNRNATKIFILDQEPVWIRWYPKATTFYKWSHLPQNTSVGRAMRKSTPIQSKNSFLELPLDTYLWNSSWKIHQLFKT